MATSGSKSVTVSTYDTLKFNWSIKSQSIPNNTSTVSWNLQLITTGAGKINSTKNKSYSIKVNGNTYSGTNTIGIGNNETKTLVSGTTVIPHNADGSKTFSYSFSQEFDVTLSNTHIGTITGSGTGTLNNIPRAATVTSVSNFTDEENLTFTYDNPAGTAVTSLQACISSDGTLTEIPYRDIAIEGTTYTFEFTEEEKEILQSMVTDSKEKEVQIILQTVLGDSHLYSYGSTVLTIVNCEPIISATVIDTNPTTLAITGDENVFIKYYSSAEYTVNAVGQKQATIVNINVTNGNQTKTNSATSNVFTEVENKIFSFEVLDSRGYENTLNLETNFIDYKKPTCLLKVLMPTMDGNTTLTVEGICYSGDLNLSGTKNTILIECRYKTNQEEYTDWIPIDQITYDENSSYRATLPITGLDYTKAYSFQARIVDQFNTVESKVQTVKTIPVFDWSGKDLNFNTPINVNGDISVNNSPLFNYLFDLIYPIGKVIYTTRPEDPSTYLGGLWRPIKDRFILGAGDTYLAGDVGGEATHTLTTAEMPSHAHAPSSQTAGAMGGYNMAFTVNVGVGHEAVARRQVSTSSSSGIYAMTSNKSGNYIADDGYTTSVGGSAAHNNMPPYKVVYIWERIDEFTVIEVLVSGPNGNNFNFNTYYGTTWEDWINNSASDAVKDNIYIEDDLIKFNYNSTIILLAYGSTPVKLSDRITETSYSFITAL